jgi:hypothetical protein
MILQVCDSDVEIQPLGETRISAIFSSLDEFKSDGSTLNQISHRLLVQMQFASSVLLSNFSAPAESSNLEKRQKLDQLFLQRRQQFSQSTQIELAPISSKSSDTTDVIDRDVVQNFIKKLSALVSQFIHAPILAELQKLETDYSDILKSLKLDLSEVGDFRNASFSCLFELLLPEFQRQWNVLLTGLARQCGSLDADSIFWIVVHRISHGLCLD